MKVTEKQVDQGEQKSDLQQTLSLSPSVIKVKEYSVPGVENVGHISYHKSGNSGSVIKAINLFRQIYREICYGGYTLMVYPKATTQSHRTRTWSILTAII